MDFFLTTMWIFGASWGGYFLGSFINSPKNLPNILCAIGIGFFALIIRYCPEFFADFFECIADIITAIVD